MPSHLTRIVFRNIIANKPLAYHGCLYRATRPPIALSNGVRAFPQLQRRSFINFFKPQRKFKSAELPPGFEVLTELAHHQRTAARPPPPADITQAFNAFFAPRQICCEDFHISIAHNAFEYLQKNPKEDGAPWLSKEDLDRALNRLIDNRPESGGKEHLTFGTKLHQAVIELIEKEKPNTLQSNPPGELSSLELQRLPALIRLMCLYGASLGAKDIAMKTFSTPGRDNPKHQKDVVRVWGYVIQGFAREHKEKELREAVEKTRDLSLPLDSHVQNTLVMYYIQQGNLDQAKYWYLQPVVDPKHVRESEPSLSTHAAILKACAFAGDLSFGHQVVASLLKDIPTKEAWDAVFLWSASIGKGVDEIDRMMTIQARRHDEERRKNPAIPSSAPDTDTINALVELSMFKKDIYTAERFISLGEKRRIYPNEKTFTMQIQYRLSVKDLDGAKAAYYGLQGNMEGSEESIKAINCLIQALCEARQHHFDDTMAIVDDLLERKARLTPETVACLCALHLRRGENHDAMDILQVHAHHFSPDQRVVIREKLAAFLLDGQTSTADAWDTYQILRNSFPETPRDIRIRIMNEFFARKRSDMACHVFFHMRNHVADDLTANRDVYVAAFSGFARNADAESLELAHNQLKLDLNVETDTKMRNALMLAYAATGNSRRALEIWAEIGTSKEGPTYNSIAIAFRACEGMPFGDEHANSIWKRLKEMDVEIDKEIFTAYLGAIARNHAHDEALALVESAEEEYGLTPDLYILGNWFNTTAHIERQGKVEQWIKKHYPAIWSELEALGFWVTMDGFGYRQCNFNRDLEP